MNTTEAALRHLPRDVQVQARRAMRGELDRSLHRLKDLIRPMIFPDTGRRYHLQPILPAAYIYLEEAHIPINFSDTTDRYQRLFHICDALTLVGVICMSQDSAVERDIIHHLPRIWARLEYLDELCCSFLYDANEAYGLVQQDADYAKQAMVVLLEAFLDYAPAIREIIRKTPNVRAVMVHLWLHNDFSKVENHYDVGNIFLGYVSEEYIRYQEGILDGPPQWPSTISKETGDSIPRLAATCTELLEASLRGGFVFHVQSAISNIHYLTITHVGLADVLKSKRYIRVFLDALHLFVKEEPETTIRESQLLSSGDDYLYKKRKGFKAFSRLFLTRIEWCGVEWLAGALEHGLLPFLLLSSRTLTPDGRDICVPVMRWITTYLCYRAILKPTLQAIKEVREQRLEPPTSTWPLLAIWKNLQAIAMERSQALINTDAQRLSYLCCHRPLCTVEYRKITFSQCAQCRNALYCSRQCQRLDWDRHREYCKDAQRCFSFAFDTGSMSSREIRFIKALVCDHLRKHEYGAIFERKTLCMEDRLPDHTDPDTFLHICDFTKGSIEVDVKYADHTLDLSEQPIRDYVLESMNTRHRESSWLCYVKVPRPRVHSEDCPFTALVFWLDKAKNGIAGDGA